MPRAAEVGSPGKDTVTVMEAVTLLHDRVLLEDVNIHLNAL